MADYLPVRIPGKALVVPASAAVTGGQLVQVSGSNTCAATAAASAAWLGVAAFDVASGGLLTIHCGGTQELTASGDITAGDIVVAAAAGAVATNATPGSGQQVGIALTTAASGAKVRVQMAR